MGNSATVWTVATVAAASLSALFAALYTWLTFRLVRSQREPNVVVYVKHDESRPSLLMIVIANVGQGLATDVAFKSSRPIPHHAFGIEYETAEIADQMTDGPLINGIPTLGPGDSRRLDWGQYGGLKKSLGDEPIVLTCEFKDGKRALRPTVSRLEISSFMDTSAVGSEGARLLKEFEKLTKSVDEMTRSLAR